MTSRELRQSFLDFFAGKDHKVLPSAPLKPSDPTTLFTSAGMQPFVPWFRGLLPPEAPRVATCQKCFRADDMEEVGRTPVHCTFFEMLGNFSFGDYFKRDAIAFAWEYATRVLSLPKHRIWISVHPDDDEAYRIWSQDIGVPKSRIVYDKTNWWGPVGNSGPCGPDSELYLDLGEDRGCGRSDCNPLCECNRMDEFWNLVFQMYNKTETGELEPLPKTGIDTGMGLERTVRLLEDVPTIFETDLFAPIISGVIARLRSSIPDFPARLNDTQQITVRVIAEHARALAFLLADGFTPSNDGAGYVLRRLLRRAYRYGHRLGLREPFLHDITPSIVAAMGPIYPELRNSHTRIKTWLEQEEKQFEETLERGFAPLTAALDRAKTAGHASLSGEEAFKLHDTYGLPIELTADLAAEQGLTVDVEGFSRMMEEQRKQARARAEEDFAFATRTGYQTFAGKTIFLGYETCRHESNVIGIIGEQGPAERLSAGEVGEVFLDKTSFYAEGGGQVGDRGVLTSAGIRAEVLDTYHPLERVHTHKIRVIEGTIELGVTVLAEVDAARRRAIARAHTATHLLHHMLRTTLGDHAIQSGSLVDADRLRFDFTHFSALTVEERHQIETGVLALSLQDEPLQICEMPRAEAERMGATALFGEKYGERVRVVQIGQYSKELCGGTHLEHVGSIGGFFIVTEGSIGAGLRRIEAVTGLEAQVYALKQRELLMKTAQLAKSPPEELFERVQSLQSELREKQRELTRLQQKGAGELVGDLLKLTVEVDGVKLVATRVEAAEREALRALADEVRTRLGSGIVLLGSVYEGSVQLVASVSKDLVEAGYHAGNLIREVAKVTGGGGGGRPDFAQAGGKEPAMLDRALAQAQELVAAQRR